MPRKIFLDGDKNGNRPTPMAVATIMMIPIVVILIMKSRQSKRRSTGTGVEERVKDEGSGKDESRRREERPGNETEAKDPKDKKGKDGKSGETAPKTDAEKKRDKERKKKEEEAAKKIASEAKKNREKAHKLQQQTADLDQKKLDFEAKANPDDPVMHPERFPDEMYDVNNRPLTYSKDNKPKKSAMAKRDAQGKVIPRAPDKRINLGVDREAPSTEKPRHEYATFRIDQGGFVKHDGPLRHKDQYKYWNQTKETMPRDRATDRHPNNNALGDPQTQQWFRSKTEELESHIGPSAIGVFKKAQEIVLARYDNPLYEKAMAEDWHEHFGVWPAFAGDVVDAIIALIEDKHIQIIYEVMNAMQPTDRKLTSEKDITIFLMVRLRVPQGRLPGKSLFVHGWFFDSFRLISASVRMNLMRGPPANAETEGVLGKVFLLFEWLEIFGVMCAKQRLLSRRGFDLPGLCMRLHCHSDAARKAWILQLTIFTSGGPEMPPIPGMRPRSGDPWADRLTDAAGSWQGVWSTLFTECASIGIENEGFQAFETRQLLICPGYTLKGVNAAGGLASGDTSRFAAEQARAVSEADLRSMTTQLHEGQEFKYDPSRIASTLTVIFCEMRPQTLIFWRHRQYNWCKASLTATSNDYTPGEIMFWLKALGEGMLTIKAHRPGHKEGKALHLSDMRDITNIQHQENQMPIRTIDFGGSIPIVHDKTNNARTFPSLEGHRKLENVVLTYVPFTRGTDNKPALQTELPATAILAFANSMGLRPQLDAREGLGVIVAVKDPNEVQQLERELQEQVILSLRQELGPGGKASANTIAQYEAKQTAWLGRIKTRGPDLKLVPVGTRINWPADIRG